MSSFENRELGQTGREVGGVRISYLRVLVKIQQNKN